jgi:hypothetical protein
MRQVMPHRNNMVDDLRRCKSFLYLNAGRRRGSFDIQIGRARSALDSLRPPQYFQ